MNIFKAYFFGLKKAAGLPRPVFLIYFVNLLLALLIVFPLYSIADVEIGNSLKITNLLQEFRWTVFSDFFRDNAEAVKAVSAQVKWILLIYWLLSVFFAGGIIRTLNEAKFSMASFFHGAGYNFFRFLGISLILLIFHLVAAAVIYIPAFLIINNTGLSSEKAAALIAGIAVLIHIFMLVLLFALNDYSKFYGVLYNKNSFHSTGGGLRYLFSHFSKAYFLYLFLLIIPAAAVYGYFRADAETATHTRKGVLLIFIVQQAFIILRIWFRIWIFASPLRMFKADLEKAEAENTVVV